MSNIEVNSEKSNLIDTKLPVSKYKISSSIFVFLFPALGGLLFGYDIGATSSAIIQIQSSQYSGVLWWQTIKNSSLLQGIITSISMLGAMIGCLICFKVADQLGRRKTILISCYFYFAGSIIEFISGYSQWKASIGISVLIIGRFIYGIGCGFAMQGAPAYIGEMAPFQIRGVLISLKEAFIVLGMLLGYSIGYAFSEVIGGWTITYGITSILAMVMFTGMYFLPDSARWLALKNRTKEALNALRFVTPELSYAEITAITDLASKASSYNQKSTLYEDWIRLTSPNILPAMISGVGLVVFQQV